MLPSSLVAPALVPLFPLALEIDYGATIPGGPADGKGYHLRVVVKVAPGKTGVDYTTQTDRPITPAPLGPCRHDMESILMRMRKWSFYRQGTALVILGFDGSPVTKVEITSNGPKPTARWIPNPGSRK